MTGGAVSDPQRTYCVVVSGKYYLLDVFRRRLDYPDLKRAVWEQARKCQHPKVLIEDKGSGTQLIQELKREGLLYIRPYLPPTNTDKIVRLFAKAATSSRVECSYPAVRRGSMTTAVS